MATNKLTPIQQFSLMAKARHERQPEEQQGMQVEQKDKQVEEKGKQVE